jgi:PAS domain-containing protein
MLSPNLTIALLLAVPVLMLTLASFAWRKRSTPGGIELILLLCALALWGGLSGINRLSPDLESSVWILKFQFIGILGVGPALLATALASNGLRIHTRPLGIAALLVPMFVGLAMAFTTERHGLMWSNLSMHDAGGLPRFAMTRGLGMWLMVAWSYLMIGSGVGMLAYKWRRNWAYYRGEALPTLIGIAVPIGFNVVYLAKADSGPQLDFTPVAFSIPAMAFAWSLLFRDGIFDIVRFAQREILDAMTECGVVADLRGRLIYANEAARTRLGIAVALPAPLEIVLAQHPRVCEILSRDAEASSELGDRELEVGDEGARTIYDLELTPLADPLGRLTSRVLVLRDITERKLAEQRIRALAFYDSLTGLPNRRRFQRLLSHALNSAEHQPRKLALLFLDLDRFK